MFTSYFSSGGAFTGFSSTSSGGVPAGGLMDFFKGAPAMAKGGDSRGLHRRPININIGSGYTSREIGNMVSRELQESYGNNSGVRRTIKAAR